MANQLNTTNATKNDLTVDGSRRKLIKSAAFLAVPAGMTRSEASANQANLDVHRDHLLDIAQTTGLSLDDMVQWFDNVDLTQIVQNISKWRDSRNPGMPTDLPLERINFHAGQLRQEMKRRHGGEWFSAINEDTPFILISN